MTGGFLNGANLAVIGLIRVGVPEGHRDGVGGMALNMGGQVQKLLAVNHFRMNGGNFKDAFGEGAGLVKYYGLYP